MLHTDHYSRVTSRPNTKYIVAEYTVPNAFPVISCNEPEATLENLKTKYLVGWHEFNDIANLLVISAGVLAGTVGNFDLVKDTLYLETVVDQHRQLSTTCSYPGAPCHHTRMQPIPS